jgi:hypothetical protein
MGMHSADGRDRPFDVLYILVWKQWGFREQDQQRGKGDGDGGMASDVQEPSGLPLVVVEKLSSG